MLKQEWFVDDLQAVEPDELTKVEGVEVTVSPEKDSMGFDRVEVRTTSLSALLDYCRENWGDSDEKWFREWVVDRVRYVSYEPADEEPEPTREFLVHLNIQVPAETETSTEEIVRELRGALEVGIDTVGDADTTPTLAVAEIEVALAEEI
jgi:hypothetical protein